MAFLVGMSFQSDAVLANVFGEIAKTLHLIFSSSRLSLLMLLNGSLVFFSRDRGQPLRNQIVPSESGSNTNNFSLGANALHVFSQQQLRHSSPSTWDLLNSVFPEHVSYTSYLYEMSLFA